MRPGSEARRVCVRELPDAAVQVGVNRLPDDGRRQVGGGIDAAAVVGDGGQIQRQAAVGAVNCLRNNGRQHSDDRQNPIRIKHLSVPSETGTRRGGKDRGKGASVIAGRKEPETVATCQRGAVQQADLKVSAIGQVADAGDQVVGVGRLVNFHVGGSLEMNIAIHHQPTRRIARRCRSVNRNSRRRHDGAVAIDGGIA